MLLIKSNTIDNKTVQVNPLTAVPAETGRAENHPETAVPAETGRK